jgi:hypothetical protein
MTERFDFQDALAAVAGLPDDLFVGSASPSTLGEGTPSGGPPLGSLFRRSPSTGVSGATVGGTGEDQKLRVIRVSDKSATCGGLIGGVGISLSGTRFCGKAADECDVQSHKMTKVALENHTLYVKVKKGKLGSQCRLTPSLPVNRLPIDKPVGEVLEAEHSVTIWSCLFNEWVILEEKTGIKELGGDGSSDAQSWVQIDRTGVDEWENAADFRSPKKVKLMPYFSQMEKRDENAQMPAVKSLNFDAEEGNQLKLVLENWRDVCKNFDAIQDKHQALDDNNRELKAKVTSQLVDVHLADRSGPGLWVGLADFTGPGVYVGLADLAGPKSTK